LVWVEIRGFRVFGSVARRLDMDAPMVAVHAQNSHGKSSLAEALEFLFTGHSTRRDLLGGAKAEYNDSLRNAHLPDGDNQVYVAAGIRDASGTVHEVRRELVTDFGAGTECKSLLLVDGSPADNLAALGLPLADPPVRAPVLLQHTLRYVLSTEPKQRVAYFKALLSLTDLDELRGHVAAAKGRIEKASPGPALRRLDKLAGTKAAHAAHEISQLADGAPDRGRIVHGITRGLLAAGPAMTGRSSDDLEGLAERLEEGLNGQREATFPLGAFASAPFHLPAAKLPDLKRYDTALVEVDREVARLVPVIEAVLAVDDYADLTTAHDCPICATPSALTPARIKALQDQLRRTTAVDEAASVTLTQIRVARNELDLAHVALANAVPVVANWGSERLDTVRITLRHLGVEYGLAETAYRTAKVLAATVESGLDELKTAIGDLDSVETCVTRRTDITFDLEARFASLTNALEGVRTAASAHVDAVAALRSAVEPAVTVRIANTGLTELLAIVTDVDALATDLLDEAARRRAVKRIAAVESILREAAGRVLDDRFTQMGDTITRWWESLRPEELVGFAGVKRRAGGALYVNLVATLRADVTTHPVERDALGVYSDSQLNALGLSTFLARAELLGCPIVVLDDPIPGSDAEHRLTFVQNTLALLLDAGVQVVMTTFDGKLSEWAQSNHDYRGFVSYELTLTDPVAGTEPTQTSDMFSRLLLEAEDNLHAPTARGRRAACGSYRSAAERLAKQIIATARTHSGQLCSVADVHTEARTLGELVPLVRGFALSKDEPGKWSTFNKVLNPGNHDDDVPSTTELTQVRGNLRRISKEHRAHWPGGLLV
jgi:hypothetical protein